MTCVFFFAEMIWNKKFYAICYMSKRMNPLKKFACCDSSSISTLHNRHANFLLPITWHSYFSYFSFFAKQLIYEFEFFGFPAKNVFSFLFKYLNLRAKNQHFNIPILVNFMNIFDFWRENQIIYQKIIKRKIIIGDFFDIFDQCAT